MKSVFKILLVALLIAPRAHATVFDVDCTATYSNNGISNSAREHGTITIDHDLGSPKLMLPMIDVMGQAPYYAHAQFNVRPRGAKSDWRLWFTRKTVGDAIKDWTGELSLTDLNKATLEAAPSPTEMLSFSCSFGNAGNSVPERREASESDRSPGWKEAEVPTPPRGGELKFDHFAVMREFGGTDTGALLGILPSTSHLEITAITGPRFLGDAHVGALTPSVISKLFNHSANPMPERERQELLTRYQGATILYFENYPSELCNGKTYELVAKGRLGEITTRTTFRFAAIANQAGDCTMITSAFMTSY